MTNLILIVAIAGILGCAIGYIWGKKKKGAVCIGCPYGDSCGGNCGGCH